MGFRPDCFDWQIPLQLGAASIGRLVGCLSSRDERIGILETVFGYSLPQSVALLADANRVIPQLCAEDPLDKQDGLEG